MHDDPNRLPVLWADELGPLLETARRAVAVAAATSRARGDCPRVNPSTSLGLASAYLLCAEVLAGTARRALHLPPATCQPVVAASRYVLPLILHDLLTEAVALLGDETHGTGEGGGLAAQLRWPLALGMSDEVLGAALSVLTAHLARFDAALAWSVELSGQGSDLTSLDRDAPSRAPQAGQPTQPGEHRATAEGELRISTLFIGATFVETIEAETLALAGPVGVLLDQMERLLEDARQLRSRDPGTAWLPEVPEALLLALAERYALVLVGMAVTGSCLQLRRQPHRQPRTEAGLLLGLELLLSRLCGHRPDLTRAEDLSRALVIRPGSRRCDHVEVTEGR